MKQGFFSRFQAKLRCLDLANTRSDGVHCARTKRIAMFRRTLIPVLAAVLMTSAAITPAHAQRGRDRGHEMDNPFQRGDQWDRPRDERMQQRDVPLGEVLRDLRSKYGGQHLDARKAGGHYIIAWMTEDGRRLNIRVNASTGREE
jgi:hypothetical protein